LEILIFFILVIIYWCSRSRRQYFKQRVDKDRYQNLKTVARNIAQMIYSGKQFKFFGDSDLIKNGAILYSLHFGVWELMPKIVHSYLNKNIGILVNHYTDNNSLLMGKLMDKIFYYWRSSNNVRIFYPDEVFQIVNFLKNGGVFAALIDGDTFYTKFKKIEKLASLCQVPLIPFAVYCENGTTIMKIGCNLEELVKKRPNDYWWFYKSRKSVKVL